MLMLMPREDSAADAAVADANPKVETFKNAKF